MTPKLKGQQYCLLVTDIKNAYKTRNNKYIHLITFQDTDGSVYMAEEMEADPVSRFVKNLKNNFTLTNPGIGGNLDWVRFSCLEDKPHTPAGSSAQRENIFVAQTALSNAVLFGMQQGWNLDTIYEKAFEMAGNIKQIALQLQEETI